MVEWYKTCNLLGIRDLQLLTYIYIRFTDENDIIILSADPVLTFWGRRYVPLFVTLKLQITIQTQMP